MGLRRYDFATCNIKRFSTIEVRGSMVQDTVLVYSDIPCSYWKKTENYGGTALSTQSDSTSLELNLDPEYEVYQGDIVELRGKDYKIVDIIPHPDRTWDIDNQQIFLQPSKDD